MAEDNCKPFFEQWITEYAGRLEKVCVEVQPAGSTEITAAPQQAANPGLGT